MAGLATRDQGMYLNGRLAPGTILEGSMTVTETHLVLGAGLIGGFHPVHVDEQFAVAAGLRGRILHGALTAAIMSTVVGRNLPPKGWTVVEQCTRFRAPVYCGDTLQTRWTVQEPEVLSEGRLLLTLMGECTTQGQGVVADGTVKLMLRQG
jgi:3-hydroxybutyryl-CoA dehydratase